MDVVFSKAAADEFNLVTGFVALGFNPSTDCDLADFTRGNQEFFVYVFKITLHCADSKLGTFQVFYVNVAKKTLRIMKYLQHNFGTWV